MSLITFTSDFGLQDHYTAAVKAKIYTISSSIDMIDISHNIDSFNIAHGSFVLRSVYKDFPDHTVHLIAVNSVSENGKYVAVQLGKHFFVSADNGIISLLSDSEPTEAVELPVVQQSVFPAKEVLGPAAAAIAMGEQLKNIGTPIKEINRKIGRMLKANRKQISGNVVRIDHYGNLITNIDEYTFDILSDGKNFSVLFGRERAYRIHKSYNDIDSGECFLLFNEQGLLEIGIREGNARELLGIAHDSPIQILFD